MVSTCGRRARRGRHFVSHRFRIRSYTVSDCSKVNEIPLDPLEIEFLSERSTQVYEKRLPVNTLIRSELLQKIVHESDLDWGSEELNRLQRFLDLEGGVSDERPMS